MEFRLLLSVILLMSMTLGAHARYISEDEALANAKSFMSENKLKTAHRGLLKLAHKENADYYVFSKGDNAGYVIVSGSDKTDAILGYVDNGNFDASNLPENVAYWMNEYSRQIEAAEAGNYVQKPLSLKSTKTVAPLLKDIMWNQNSPYNDKCPVLADGRRCASGCVATAFAQVMYYYKWPETGVGSKNYTTHTNIYNLSADFGATTYRWDAMTPFYNASNSEESKDAVAELMFHVGVALEMDYNYASGTSTVNAVKAMANNFRYDKRIRCIYRDFYSRDEWDKIMKTELDNNRPVPYAGAVPSDGGAHQFVLDGYDANDMFHVNWGWGGSYDGYFKLSILNPEGQGIGGFEGGYNVFQSATVGMMKPDASVELPEYPYLCGQSYTVETKSVKKGEIFKYRLYYYFNYAQKVFNGYINLGLFNNKDELVATSSKYSLYGLKENYGWAKEENVFSAEFSDVPDGKYYVCPIEKLQFGGSWIKSRFQVGSGKIIATVSGNNITFENVESKPDLSVSDIVVEESYEGISTKVSYKVHNNGSEYAQPFIVVICDNATSLNVLYFGTKNYNPIKEGETIEIETNENFGLKAGDYVLTVVDYDGNILSDFIDLKILAKPGEPELVPMALNNKDEYHRDDFEFSLDLVNYGGLFKNDMYVFIYDGNQPSQDLNSYVDMKIKSSVVLPGGSTSSTVIFKYNLLLPEGPYFVLPGYKTGKSVRVFNYGFAFKLVEGSGVEVVETDENAFSIYPNPVEDVLNLAVTGNLEKVSIFNMNGKLMKYATEATIDVSELAAGSYIVIAEVDGKPSSKTFIKK